MKISEFLFYDYKGMEEKKWKSRESQIGLKFPIFDNSAELKENLDSGEIINVNSLKDIGNLTKNNTLEGIKQKLRIYLTFFAKLRILGFTPSALILMDNKSK